MSVLRRSFPSVRRAFSSAPRARQEHAHTQHEKQGYGLHPPFWERALLGVGSAVGLLVKPSRGDLLSVLTQVSSYPTIDRLVEQMRSTHEGRRLLIARPSLNSHTVDVPKLWALPDGTFGKEWVRWLKANHVGPDGRCDARYMPTLETRYVIQRYRETHDFYHVLLGMPTSTLGETVVKYFEMTHMRQPVAALSALGGSLRILNDDRRALMHQHAAVETSQLRALAPWAVQSAKQLRLPLISIEWEKRWEQPMDALRAELGLDTPPPVVLPTHTSERPSSRPRVHVAGRRFYGWPSRVWERHGARDPRSAPPSVPTSP